MIDNQPGYCLHSNNCGDAVQDVLKAGDIDTPIDIDARPNTMFENMTKSFNE
jgi:hypothetical protein